jgi:hypothetical protein
LTLYGDRGYGGQSPDSQYAIEGYLSAELSGGSYGWEQGTICSAAFTEQDAEVGALLQIWHVMRAFVHGPFQLPSLLTEVGNLSVA